jgi:hypothetical protein
MWLFSGVPEDPEDEIVMKVHSADAQCAAVKSSMYAIRTEDHDVQHDSIHQLMEIAKPWMIRRWSELKLTNGKPLVQILKTMAHLVNLE